MTDEEKQRKIDELRRLEPDALNIVEHPTVKGAFVVTRANGSCSIAVPRKSPDGPWLGDIGPEMRVVMAALYQQFPDAVAIRLRLPQKDGERRFQIKHRDGSVTEAGVAVFAKEGLPEELRAALDAHLRQKGSKWN